jgi:hypothetical protein
LITIGISVPGERPATDHLSDLHHQFQIPERLLKEGKWEEVQVPLKKSNRFLEVVLKYLPEDEAYRNIYGDHVVIFLPNLLMAEVPN